MTEYNKNDPVTIQKMFDSIATQYDKTNAILSFNMHTSWNKALIKKVIIPAKPEVLLDLCCGTGAIAFEYLKKIKNPLKVYMLDFSEGMLSCARLQSEKLKLNYHNLHFLQADAQNIPLPENSVNCATIAYGIRNVKNPELCIEDIYRVLKPGGSLGILELTQPNNPLLRSSHSFYLKNILPLIGKMITSNKDAYAYLCNSIHTFIPSDKLMQVMKKKGFKNIRQHTLLGGIATVLTGMKAKNLQS